MARSGETAFAAFTGKAALVMRSKGCVGASTIHALIYRASEGDDGAPTFTLNHDGPASRAALIVIDECSMVDAELGRDLLSFGKPILVLGDPAQLPPVKGGGFLHRVRARRDADDRFIARRRTIRSFACPRSSARAERSPTANTAKVASSAATRSTPPTCSRPIRFCSASIAPAASTISASASFGEPRSRSPVAGDKLVCLRNDRVKGLINGGLWRVETYAGLRKDFVRMTVKSEDDPGRPAVRVAVLRQFFEGAEADLPYATRRDSDEFDYGYALTVHKAQGSQWDAVVLFDESRAFREHRARWLYTGLTRAARRLTLVR